MLLLYLFQNKNIKQKTLDKYYINIKKQIDVYKKKHTEEKI